MRSLKEVQNHTTKKNKTKRKTKPKKTPLSRKQKPEGGKRDSFLILE